MSDQARVVSGIALGAVVGGLAAYCVFTPRGRASLAQVNPALDDVTHALQEFRRALRKARGVAHEARLAVEDVHALQIRDALPGEAH